MDDLRKFSELHGETQEGRLEFLRTDLALCFTLAELVDTVLGLDDLNAALRVKANAEGEQDAIARFLVNVDDGADKDALQQGLNELRTRLDRLPVPSLPLSQLGPLPGSLLEKSVSPPVGASAIEELLLVYRS